MQKVKKYSYKVYVTDDYVEAVYWALENNVPIEDITEPEVEPGLELVQQILKDGEEVVMLDGIHYGACLTSFGRLITAKSLRQHSTRFYESGQFIYLRKVKVEIEQTFKQQDWEYDMETIIGHYENYNWAHKNFIT